MPALNFFDGKCLPPLFSLFGYGAGDAADFRAALADVMAFEPILPKAF